MEIEYNDATRNRPEGKRVLNAPFVFIDLADYTRQLKNEEAWVKNDRNSITVFKNEQMTTVLICLHEAAVIENNAVDGLISIQVLEGKIKLQVETEESEMISGQIAVLQPFINHELEAMEDCILLLSNTMRVAGL